MDLKALLCVPFGHRWETAIDEYEAFPVLTCKRCGQEQERHEEVRDATTARLDTHHALRDTDHAYGFFGRPRDWTK